MNKEQFRKVYAAIFVVLAMVFGILVCIAEKDYFQALGNLSFNSQGEMALSVMIILNVIIDIAIIAVPAIFLILLLTSNDKTTPFKAICQAAQAVLTKYVFIIFIWLFYLILMGADGQAYKDYFFGSGSMMIIPTIIFLVSGVALGLATSKSFANNQTGKVIATVIGSAAAIVGLCVYYGFENTNDGLVIFGMVVAIVCFAGLVVYCFLPQTKE